MLKFMAMTLTLLASGCLNANAEAICDGLRKDVDALNAALLIDAGDLSVTTGQAVISRFDQGCG